jgi:hypothetical protein
MTVSNVILIAVNVKVVENLMNVQNAKKTIFYLKINAFLHVQMAIILTLNF